MIIPSSAQIDCSELSPRHTRFGAMCRPISSCSSRLGQPAPGHAAAAEKLAAHQFSAECLLTELRDGTALRGSADSGQRERRSRMRPALARRAPPLLLGDGHGIQAPQPVTPVDQWLLAPSPS